MTGPDWHGGARSTSSARVLVVGGALVALAAVPATVAVALAEGGGTVPAVLMAVVLLGAGGVVAWAGVTFSRVRVRVDAAGVHVACGPQRRPSWSWARTELEGADVDDVRPGAYGGWGLRWTPTARAVLVRPGPGLRLTPRRGKPFVVTVDDPAGAVRALALGPREPGGADGS